MLRYVFALLFLANACLAQDISEMDSLCEIYESNGQFMGSVLVARGDQVLFSKSYGSADLEWNVPNTSTTKFRIGSITKQFTAASVLLLEERGKLKIQDPIRNYLPDTPPAWDSITIFHLLTHTSGLPPIHDPSEAAKLNPFAVTPAQNIAKIHDKPLEFAPGSQYKYCNPGYILLGLLIEKVSGKSYQEFLQENIFSPLGMNDSGYDSNSDIIPRRANGYAPGLKGVEHAPFIHMSLPFSAGALYSTTEDLLRWERGLFGGKLLSAESLEKMTTPFKEDYGFGLHINTFNGRQRIIHGGGIEGFNTYLAYFPDSKITVITLANLNGNVPQQLEDKLAALAHGDSVTLPSVQREITVDPSILAKYAGTYRLRPGTDLTVTLENGQLITQVIGQQKFPIYPESETTFFLKVADATYEFVKDDKGDVSSVVLRQGSREIWAPRISEKK